MKQLICEMCGSNDLVKQDGVFVCQSCGTKYSIEEAKKMMVEGTVDVTGSTVKVDTSDELANLYQIARRAKKDNNSENAAKYYEMVLMRDPVSWEASFYVVYFKAMECKISQIQSAIISVTNCIDTVLELIKDNVTSKDEQKAAYTEVANRVMIISDMLINGAKSYYDGIDKEIRSNHDTQEFVSNGLEAVKCVYILGDTIDFFFGSDMEANQLSASAWRQGVAWHQYFMPSLANKDVNRDTVNEYTSKIEKYDSEYKAPEENVGGCYIATSVYGSYDCPQVWTLRRFRDYILAKTWYGRVFIRVYYAVSPTIVKWFGHSKLFKKIWKSKLDKMIANLNSDGFEDTPYMDQRW